MALFQDKKNVKSAVAQPSFSEVKRKAVTAVEAYLKDHWTKDHIERYVENTVEKTIRDAITQRTGVNLSYYSSCVVQKSHLSGLINEIADKRAHKVAELVLSKETESLPEALPASVVETVTVAFEKAYLEALDRAVVAYAHKRAAEDAEKMLSGLFTDPLSEVP